MPSPTISIQDANRTKPSIGREIPTPNVNNGKQHSEQGQQSPAAESPESVGERQEQIIWNKVTLIFQAASEADKKEARTKVVGNVPRALREYVKDRGLDVGVLWFLKNMRHDYPMLLALVEKKPKYKEAAARKIAQTASFYGIDD